MGSYYAALGGSRVCDSSRNDKSGADDADVTNWNKRADFILAVNINSAGKDTEAAQYSLNWRNVTTSGSFAAVAATGQINYSAATVLVQGANILVANRKCSSIGGDTWQNGEEVEGTNLSDAIDLPDEYETEIHFALRGYSAFDGHTYEFELYDSTRGASVGTCGATITMAANVCLNVLTGL